MVLKLNDVQLERGVRRLAYGGMGRVPSLPEFVKLCRTIANDDFDEGVTPAGPALPNPDTWQGDAWDAAANRHLIAYVMRRMLQKRPVTQRELPAFLTMKAAWARDCREYVDEATGEIGRPPVPDQQAWWADVMNTAEQINARGAAA